MTLLTTVTAAYLRLADDPPVDVDPSTGKGPEWGKASPVGLLVILLLAIATFFLLRSMTRRLKRVQDASRQPEVTALVPAQGGSQPMEDPAPTAEPGPAPPPTADSPPR